MSTSSSSSTVFRVDKDQFQRLVGLASPGDIRDGSEYLSQFLTASMECICPVSAQRLDNHVAQMETEFNRLKLQMETKLDKLMLWIIDAGALQAEVRNLLSSPSSCSLEYDSSVTTPAPRADVPDGKEDLASTSQDGHQEQTEQTVPWPDHADHIDPSVQRQTNELVQALRSRGLELTGDRQCCQYIFEMDGALSLQETVDIMFKMHVLHEHTNYPARLALECEGERAEAILQEEELELFNSIVDKIKENKEQVPCCSCGQLLIQDSIVLSNYKKVKALEEEETHEKEILEPETRSRKRGRKE
jgi:hypothetical protein